MIDLTNDKEFVSCASINIEDGLHSDLIRVPSKLDSSSFKQPAGLDCRSLDRNHSCLLSIFAYHCSCSIVLVMNFEAAHIQWVIFHFQPTVNTFYNRVEGN